MKKTLFLLFAALFAANLSFGQFALGIKAGYNANKLSTDADSIKSDINSGFHIGAFSRIGKRLYLAPEVQYTMSGAVFTKEGNVDYKQKVKIGSLEIPVLVGFKIIHSDFITWRIEVGPEASFVLNSKVSTEGSVKDPITGSDLNTTNWYVLGGTGIDILFLKFDLRYQYGLNDLISDVQASSYNSKNQMFVVSVGWKIFGKK